MALLQGEDLKQAFSAATNSLERFRDTINALNVFPVPDGDTGTNMLLTMRSALERFTPGSILTAGEAADTLAEGAFWGARGNSGVILSQFFKGFAEALHGSEACDGSDLARGFSRASDAAYASVGQPVEGTMLTVIRDFARATQEMWADSKENTPLDLWETAFLAAQQALSRTPSQLPLLREAGVVDAGGMGMVVIMGGALCYLAGRPESMVEEAVSAAQVVKEGADGPVAARIDPDYLDSTQEVQWGYCIQFILHGENLSLDAVRQHYTDMINSAVVGGDRRLIRVHIHSEDPGPALSYGASMGQLSHIEIENMNHQNLGFIAEHGDQRTTAAPIGVVAVTPGDGLALLFREAGCAGVISGGQTMNPSVQAILEAAKTAAAKDVIILPNDKNVVLAAEQASAGSNGRIHVVPSRSVPQGVAAVLCFNPEESLEHNLEAMRQALDTVVSIEVTMAVRPSNINGVPVAAGEYIGLRDGELTSSGSSPEEALTSIFNQVGLSPEAVVGVYWGADTSQPAAEELVRHLEEAHPGMQVDLIYGGQHHYQYLASVE